MKHPKNSSLFLLIIFTLNQCVSISSYEINSITNDVASNLSSNHFNYDLPPMPSLEMSNFEMPKSVNLVKNISDRKIRSSFFRPRSAKQIDNQPIDEIASSKQLINSMNTFTFKLFAYLMNKYDNIIISPISLYSNLIALHAAASGSTEAQLTKLLSLTGISDEHIAAGYRTILNWLETDLGEKNELKLLNTMLVDGKINVSPIYKEKMEKFYNMKIQNVEFSTQSEFIYQFINNLVRVQTNGNIKSIMDERPDPLSKLLIVNAVHFKGIWQKSFLPKDTSDYLFKNQDNSQSKVKMMKMLNEFRVHCDNFRLKSKPPLCTIQIPYDGEQIVMQIIQGSNSKTTLKDAVERRLNANLLNELDDKLSTKLVELGLPSFKLQDAYELREPMNFLGANSIFTKERANLDKFLARSSSTNSTNSTNSDKKDTETDLFVNQFKHKASISVDEQGTVASAATSVLIGNRSGAFKLYIDRPFIVLIRDLSNDAILFIGRVNNLNSSGQS